MSAKFEITKFEINKESNAALIEELKDTCEFETNLQNFAIDEKK